MSKITIMNDTNDMIIEIDKYTDNFKKFIEHLKDMKDEICKRKQTLAKEETALNNVHILKSINSLKIKNNSFTFMNYQRVIIHKKMTQRPTAILIARNGSRNNSYILSLLCRHELSRKGIGQKLFDKLIKKALQNNIEIIYVDTVKNTRIFYENMGFGKDDNKLDYTDSEEYTDTTGYTLKIKSYISKNNENKLEIDNIEDLDKLTNIQIGGSDYGLFSFNLIKINNQTYKLNVYKNNILFGYVSMYVTVSKTGYVISEIEEIDGNNNEDKIFIMTIYDNLCETHFICESNLLLGKDHKDYETYKNILEGSYYDKRLIMSGYDENKKPIYSDELFMYAKIHNTRQFIDRTVMAYNDII